MASCKDMLLAHGSMISLVAALKRVPGGRLACCSEDIGVAQVANRDAQVAHAHRKIALLVCKLALRKS